jgi:DNA-binding transcriptional ArsR family regulator
MSEQTEGDNAGWAIGPSIAMELDIALSVVQGYFGIGGLPEDVVALLQSLAPDWLAEAPDLLGEGSHIVSILGWAADLADHVQDGDYGRATLAIRQLTVEEALARVTAQAQPYGLTPDASLLPAERLVDLWLSLIVALYTSLGFDFAPEDRLVRRTRQDLARVARILTGGDLHARFWQWLDRFYYGSYHSWREAHAETFEVMERRVITALGAREHEGQPPEIDWLPELSPLRRYPELQSAVRQGRVRVFFWVEPIGLSDLWTLLPGWLLVSFAEPGAVYQNFQAFAADVAGRAKALADPTRLIILRMIRHFGLINTEMARALGLSRPTVSVHAKILREAGLIESHREGREVRHQIVRQEVLRLLHDLNQFLDLEDEEE